MTDGATHASVGIHARCGETRIVIRRPTRPRVAGPVGVVAIMAAVFVGCGGSDSASGDRGVPQGPLAATGEQLSQDRGCHSCHRPGGVGPEWTGLYGSEVTLDDGSVVIADEGYIRLAITDPGAQKVADFNLAMPPTDLDDDEIDAVVAYIETLGPTDSSAADSTPVHDAVPSSLLADGTVRS